MRWNTAEARYEPQMAESLEPNDDGSVWTLELRDDVSFGNGDPVDAAAVVASIQRLAGSRVSAAGFMALITSMETPDANTVVFTLNAPWGDFPYFLASTGGMIVNAKVAASMTPEAFNLNPTGAGAGPYELARFAPGESVDLVAKDDYWGGPVCIEDVKVIAPDGDQALYDSMKLGEIQLATMSEDPRWSAAAQEDGFPGVGAVSQVSQLMINTRPGTPGSDVRVRQALAAAIDLDLINERIYNGTGQFASSIVPEDSPLSKGVPGPEYDPERAKQLVAEAKAAGWDGTINLNYGNSPPGPEESVLVEAMLVAAGFDPTIESLATPDLVSRVVNEKNFEVTTWSLNVLDAAPWARLDTNLRSDSSTNRSAYGDPRMDAALAELRRATTTEEKADAIAAMQVVYNETVPGVLMRHTVEWITWDESVHGVKPTREGVAMLDKAWIEQ
jgi:peptide/nickel transport system substrate-binding protein